MVDPLNHDWLAINAEGYNPLVAQSTKLCSECICLQSSGAIVSCVCDTLLATYVLSRFYP